MLSPKHAGPLAAFPTADIQAAKFGQGLLADVLVQAGRLARALIMDHDDLPIPGEMDVDFDGVGVLLPGKVDRRQGVLRRVMRSAAVRDDFHSQLLAEERVGRQGRKPHGRRPAHGAREQFG